MQELSVLALTWNTQSIRLAESINATVVHKHRNTDYTTWRYGGHIPDFWSELRSQITQHNPTIVVIAFQEDARPGSYFHSHLLPEEMQAINYELYERTTLMGVGQTSINGLAEGDILVRGLRLSVYLHQDASLQKIPQWISLSYTPTFFRNKAAAAIYVTLPNREVLALINMHLPFDAQSLIQTVQKKDSMIRQNSILHQDQFYNEAYRTLVMEAPAQPDHVLVMGDLNYRMHPFVEWSAYKTGQCLIEALANTAQYKTYLDQHDELRQQLSKGNIYFLNEGVDNGGPLFPPTGKLKHKRDPGEIGIDAYSLGKQDQRVPSFPDRILHSTDIECNNYMRFDSGIMTRSDHAAVLGIYKV